MWREEAKISQLRNNAQQQLREAERNLASTMDKVSAQNHLDYVRLIPHRIPEAA